MLSAAQQAMYVAQNMNSSDVENYRRAITAQVLSAVSEEY
jgi:hypothetical protein